VALFAAIAGMVLLSTMIAALVILARNENMIAQLNKDEAQAAYAAEAGANWGRKVLAQRLIADLPSKVVAEPRASMGTALKTTYNSMNGAAQFIRDFAIPASGPTFAACTDCVEPTYSVFVPKEIPDAQQNVLTLTCPGTTGCPSGMAFTTRVIVGAHPTIPPLVMNGENRALFTYVWRIESSGTSGRARQQWVIHDSSVPDKQDGAFTIAVTAEFVKYAHFIDQFQDAGSGDPWMSFRHIYTGPVHTNTRFSILGNIGTKGQEGPTFRSEATQTMSSTRFNNGGSATNLKQDSSAKDWPILGPSGVFCKTADCSGFTRAFDFNPVTTGTIDPIPFPSTGALGNADDARKKEICVALGYTGTVNGRVACPTTVTTATIPTPTVGDATRAQANCANVPVVVDNECTALTPTLLGGVFVNGSLLATSGGVPYVTDLQLAHTSDGQTIVIYTYTPGCAGCTNPNRRIIIEEKRSTNQTIVTRQCLKTGAEQTDAGTCSTGSGIWYLDTSSTARNGAINQQVFTGVFTPDLGTDYGVVYVHNANIGLLGTLNGLRRGIFSTAGCTPQLAGAGGTKDCHTTGWNDPAYAIYQDTGNDAVGTRLTVAADGHVWITGHLNYRVDPRGGDLFFSDPVPGDASGTSADDQMDVQNVLGVISWSAPAAWVPTTRAGGVRLSSALDLDHLTQGMVFVANLSGNAEPSGQFSFDDPDGTYRGFSRVLGGVVQKTMGTFGQPSSNLGYARDWVYDERFRYRALSPPAFPGFPNFTAATSLGIDSYTWRLGLF
jgi:hypothetical protein